MDANNPPPTAPPPTATAGSSAAVAGTSTAKPPPHPLPPTRTTTDASGSKDASGTKTRSGSSASEASKTADIANKKKYVAKILPNPPQGTSTDAPDVPFDVPLSDTHFWNGLLRQFRSAFRSNLEPPVRQILVVIANAVSLSLMEEHPDTVGWDWDCELPSTQHTHPDNSKTAGLADATLTRYTSKGSRFYLGLVMEAKSTNPSAWSWFAQKKQEKLPWVKFTKKPETGYDVVIPSALVQWQTVAYRTGMEMRNKGLALKEETDTMLVSGLATNLLEVWTASTGLTGEGVSKWNDPRDARFQSRAEVSSLFDGQTILKGKGAVRNVFAVDNLPFLTGDDEKDAAAADTHAMKYLIQYVQAVGDYLRKEMVSRSTTTNKHKGKGKKKA